MKKLISLVLVAAIVLSTFVFSVPTAAAAEPVFAVENVEKMQGTGTTVTPKVTITDNPGIYSLKLVVYYDKTELAKSDADGFANSVFGAEDSEIGTERVGTHKDIKSYIPSDLQAYSKGFVINTVGVYNEELEDTETVTDDGIVVELPLEIIADDVGSFNYTVWVAEAYDAEGNEIYVENDMYVGTVDYIPDPYIGIYDEFTVFMTPDEKNIALETKEVSVDIRFDQNPGLWATRIYIVYPEALTLGSTDNVVNSYAIYNDPADLIVGNPDIALDDSRQVQGFKDLMAADPSIVRDGYHSTTVYFEPAAFDKVNSGNGILCTLNFTISDDVEVGDVLDIKMYYAEADFLYAGTKPDGTPDFIIYEPEIYGSELTIVECDHNYVDGFCEYCGQADGNIPSLEAENVQTMLSGADVSPKITISNNPGIHYLKLVVYYDKTELEKSDADAFANSVFGEADSAVGSERIGSHRDIKDYIPADLQSTSKGFVIDLFGEYNDNLEDTDVVTADGIVVELPLSVIAEEHGDYNYRVVVAEACDIEGNTLNFEFVGLKGTVSYVADPNVGIYDDFTVFMTPDKKDVMLGSDTVSVDIRFDQNPGLWATRIYVVYPEALTLGSEDNVVNSLAIYKSESDLVVGTPDLDLDDPRQVQGFKDVMKNDPSITKEGYHSTTIYFEPSSVDSINDGNGVLCTLNFTLSGDVEAGDVLDIKMYYSDADFLYAEISPSGYPEFISYYPETFGSDITIVSSLCEHGNTTTEQASPTCSEWGYINTVCSECGRVISTQSIAPTGVHVEDNGTSTLPDCNDAGAIVYKCTMCGTVMRTEEIPATGHSYLNLQNIIITPPTCTEDGYTTRYCDICGEPRIGDFVPAWGHDEDGDVIVDEPDCDEPGSRTTHCSLCGDVSKSEVIPALDHNFVSGTCTRCGLSITAPPVGGGDEFIVYVSPSDGEIVKGTNEISVDVVLENNPGLWSTRIFVVYPEALSLNDVDNVINPLEIYENDSDMLVGIPDLSLDDYRQPQGFKDLMEADSSIARSGYRSVTIYFEPARYDEITSEDGALCTLNFTVSDDIEAGDVLDIVMYYGESDFLYADTDSNGMPEFVSYYPDVYGAYYTVIEIDCDHVEGDAVVTNPTCENSGKSEYYCSLCGEYLREEIIPATGHLYLQPQNSVITPPTCTEDGYVTRYCDVCNEPKVEAGEPAWGHDMDGDVVIVEPTCKKEGTKITYCDFCGEISDIEYLPKNSTHNLTHVEMVEGTCHTSGYGEYWYCADCGKIFADANGETLTSIEDLVIPPVYDLAYVPYAAPCHNPGTYEYWYCPGCEAVYADAEGTILTNRKNLAIAPVCELVHVERVEACHNDGMEEYWYCPECEAVYADAAATILTNRKNLTIEAVSSLDSYRSEATCTEDGFVIIYCTICEEIISEEVIPAGNHSEEVKTFTIEATCTEFGYIIEACLYCGEAIRTIAVPAKGHHLVDTVVAPTRTERGYTIHTCATCKYSFIDSYVDPVGGEIVAGDINGDADINSIDINISKRIVSGVVAPTIEQILSGDLNGDGVINGIDCNILSRKVSGMQ